MATEAVTPNIASAPAAASTPAAPAAAPSTPAAPATPAAAPEAAAPVTPDPSAPIAPEPGEGDQAFLQRVMKTKAAQAAAKPPEPAPAEVKPPVPDPAAPAAAVPEVKPGEEVKAEGEEDEQFSLDPIGPMPTSELAKKLKESPELAAALEKAGIDRNTLFATARVAQRASKYDEIFHGDVEVAQEAYKQAEQFSGLQEAFVNAVDPDSTRAVLAKFRELSYKLDDEGNPVMENGQPVTDGTVGRFMDNVLQLVLDYQSKQGTTNKDQDLLAAIDILKARTGLRGPASTEQEGVSEEVKAERQRLETEKSEWARTQQAESQRKEQEFEVGVATGIEERVDGEITKILSQAEGINDGQRKWLLDQIKEQTTEKLKNSPLFFSKLDAIMRRPMGEKTKQARISHGIKSASAIIPDVARAVLREQGVKVQAKLEAIKAKTDAQTLASRSEVKAGGQAPAPMAQPSPAELNQMVHDEYVAKHKREPSTADMFREIAAKKTALGMR